MPDPISLAAGYFIFKTAVSMGVSIQDGFNPDNIGHELMTAAGGNFYSDLIKAGATFGGKTAWNNIVSRMRSEYNSDKPLNHDLQKAIRRSQLEATLSACESCFDDLRIQDRTLLEKLKNKWTLSPEETWLKDVVHSLTKNLSEVKTESYVPPILTDDVDVLKIADTKNYQLTSESIRQLADSIKELTIIEIRIVNPPNYSQDDIALSLERKIQNGWNKTFQSETVPVDWYKLLCDRFNEEYKINPRVTSALQKTFFQDIKADLAAKFSGFSEHHFSELGGQILFKLENIEGKQDRLYEFVKLFSDETDQKLTEALRYLKTGQDVTKRTAVETQKYVSAVIENFEVKILNRFDETVLEIKELIRVRDSSTLVRGTHPESSVDKTITEIKELLLERKNLVHHRDISIKDAKALETFFLSLKSRYKTRYDNKLDKHFEISLQINQAWEFSEKFDENAGEGKAIDIATNLFDEKGRLLIIGNPGVGKTVLLLKLANDLLNRADIHKGDAFPVIFNLASWSDEYANFNDWLVAMLNRGEGLSPDTARKLLDEERIIFLLDGLDELARNEDKETAEKIRAKCMESLTDYLDYGKKVAICSRITEFVEMKTETGQKAPVSQVIKVLDLTADQIVRALNDASHSERDRVAAINLLQILTTDHKDTFLRVLRTSFYFTTSLTVFDREVIKDCNFPQNEVGLRKYLLDKFVERKLDITENQHKFGKKETVRWLKWLARLMQKKNKISFELADLQPADLRRPWLFKALYGFIIYFVLTLALTTNLFVLVYFVLPKNEDFTKSLEYFAGNLLYEIAAAVAIFILAFLFLLLLFGFLILPFCLLFSFRVKTIVTEDSSKFSLKPFLELKTWKDILSTTVFYGLFGLLIGLLLSIAPTNTYKQKAEMIGTLVFAVVAATLIERVTNYFRIIKKFEYLTFDYQRLRTGYVYNFIRWNSIILLCCVLLINFIAFNSGTFNMRPVLLLVPFTFSLSFLNTAIFKHALLRFCLVLAPVIPIRFATFLNYATSAKLLEKDGGSWRFRHQELQDYLATSSRASW